MIAFAVERSSGQVRVVGTTDLPDGSTVFVNVWQGCARPGDPDYDPSVASDYQYVQVSGGRFGAEFAFDAGRLDEITAWVEFQPGPDQPPAVIEAYGTFGEKLRGSGVVEDSGFWDYVVVACDRPSP